jgi:hypothetical protein
MHLKTEFFIKALKKAINEEMQGFLNKLDDVTYDIERIEKENNKLKLEIEWLKHYNNCE